MNDLQTSKYFTVGEVAKLFRITERTVYACIKSKKLDAIQVGGSWRLPASQFEGDSAPTVLCDPKEGEAK